MLARSWTFRINTLVETCVSSTKTKQKRLLRFINSNPTDVAYRGVVLSYAGSITRSVRHHAKTDILEHYRVIVMAVFRKRAIPIYWKITEKTLLTKWFTVDS